jgi:hypothetical protein
MSDRRTLLKRRAIIGIFQIAILIISLVLVVLWCKSDGMHYEKMLVLLQFFGAYLSHLEGGEA